jgi:hypothetical protein
MPTTPGVSNIPPETERGPSAAGDRLPGHSGREPRDDRGKGRTDSSVDNELKGVAHRSNEPPLNHGSLRGGHEDRR